MKLIRRIVFFWLGVVHFSVGQQQLSSGIYDDEKLDRYLQRKFDQLDLPGMQVAFVAGLDLIWQGNYGIKKLGANELVSDSTLFMIASCSKPVTAFGILKLVDKGLIDLDDPVNKHLPFEVSNPKHPKSIITIRMLLAHVSSLKDNWPTLMSLYTLEEGGDSPIALKDFLHQYLIEGEEYYDFQENFWDKPPASEFHYCNVGYALLGLVIEQVSGMPFNDYINEQVFKPLGMDEAFWFLAEIPHQNIASPHELPTKHNELSETKVLKHFGYPDYPDGQIRTTASDYGKFIQMLLNQGKIDGEQFVSKEILDEFFRIQYPDVAKHQALAWNYNEFQNWIYYMLMPRLPSHTGADPGVATVVSVDRKHQTAAIIFANASPSKFLDQKRFYQEIMKRLLKEARKAKNR